MAKATRLDSVGLVINSLGFNRFFIFLLGGAGYGFLETMWRGYTHWTMILAGGICFFAIYQIEAKHGQASLWQKSLLGALIITAVEFCFGCIVNLLLGWQVWDYSSLPFNVLGQVSLVYSAFWFLLSMPMFGLAHYIQKWF